MLSLVIPPAVFLPVTATFCVSEALVLTNVTVAAEVGSSKVARIDASIAPPAVDVSFTGLYSVL